MIAKLIVASGKNAGRAIAIKRNKLLIGRAEECDVRPLSEDVSRRHCAITVGPAEVWAEDLGSRNGTYVNGVKIGERTRLSNGDIVRVGSLELKLDVQLPSQPFTGSDDDVSRLLMADEPPAGMSDTTRTLGTSAGSPPTSDSGVSSIHGGGSSAAESEPAADGSFVSGISATS
ncbi:MAG: FHA domain-containing protein, partial [Planctomycetaceae bacterium]